MLYLKHEVAVFVDVGLGVKFLGKHEMIVTLKGVAVDTSVFIAAVFNHLGQGDGCLREIVDMESDILDKSGRA